MTTLQKIPTVGDQVVFETKRMTIVEMVGQRISKVRLQKLPAPSGPIDEAKTGAA